ncbi:MAG: serine hydrolase domain-containing protein [Bacillota bacterium]
MSDRISLIDRYIKDLFSAQAFSGSVLLAEDNTVLLKKGYGMANYELDVPNSYSFKFCIASITKSITAMAIMILATKKLINLNDSLNFFIPDYPDGNKINILHLITHTSGIANINNHAEYEELANKHNTLEDLISRFKHMPPDFEPGTKFQYCNSGYLLLTYIIEKVSGKSYDQFIKDEIFNPLNMRDTGSLYREQILKNKAYGYSRHEAQLINCKTRDSSIAVGTGNLYSTVEDLYIWCKALLNGTLLSEYLKYELFVRHVFVRDNLYHGFGFMLCKSNDKIDYVYQDGGIHGYRSIYMLDPENKLYIVILGNYDYIRIIDMAKKIRSMLIESK